MKPTMKKWLIGLLSAALLAGNLPVYALNTAYAAEEDENPRGIDRRD